MENSAPVRVAAVKLSATKKKYPRFTAFTTTSNISGIMRAVSSRLWPRLSRIDFGLTTFIGLIPELHAILAAGLDGLIRSNCHIFFVVFGHSPKVFLQFCFRFRPFHHI